MTAKRVYFFSGTEYSRFDHPADSVDLRYPLTISTFWNGLFPSVDAALNWGNGKVYFFSGSQYSRFDARLDRVEPGYPRAIAGAWTDAATSAFDTGIDAAVNWGNGKAYLFKGDQYIRHDIVSDNLDPGYPKRIGPNWGNVAGTIFERDLDAAINWGNGKVYWFKGTQYGRIDVATKSLDPGYPRPIAGNWPGVFTTGVSAAVEWPEAAVAPGGFNVPTNRTGVQQTTFVGGSRFSEAFDMNIDYLDSPYPTTCSVGEYRQFVRGEFRVNGVVKTHLLADSSGGPAPAMRPAPGVGAAGDNFLEDGADLPGPPRVIVQYGHRIDTLGNTFTNNLFTPDRFTGCTYRGKDRPGLGGVTGDTVSVNLDFRGQAVDAASGDILNTASWSVVGGGTA